MKPFGTLIISALAASLASPVAVGSDDLCKPLRAFVKSIEPDETRSIEFHTSWGTNFKDSPDSAIYAKRCIYHGYAEAEPVCENLMEHGLVEFSDKNAQEMITCLSPKTKFASPFSLSKIEVDFSYGTKDRGSLIEISFDVDQDLGGMVLKIRADGY